MNQRRFDGILMLDDFYDDPEAVRARALDADFKHDWTVTQFFPTGIRNRLERDLGIKITVWPRGEGNGDYLLATEGQGSKGIHVDGSSECIAIFIYLTPDDMLPDGMSREEAGTVLWKHKLTGFTRTPTARVLRRRNRMKRRVWDRMYKRDVSDPDMWEQLGAIEYRWNRFVAFPADMFHSTAGGFGTSVQDGRLIHSYLCRAKRVGQPIGKYTTLTFP